MDSTPFLDQLSPSQADQEARVNELLDAASPSATYGRRASTSTGLVFGYYGGPGPFNATAIANGTVTCGASTTTYVVASRSTGAVSSATTTTNWNDSTNYARLYSLVSSGSAITSHQDHRMRAGGALAPAGTAVSVAIQVACSDETTALTTGTAKATFRMPHAMTLTGVRASVTTAPTGGTLLTVDINESGSTILSTKLTVDASEKTTTTAATPAVISDVSLADDAEITIDIDAVGSTIAGAGLKVTLIGTQ